MFSVVNVKSRTGKKKKVTPYFSLTQMCRLVTSISHEPKYGNVQSPSFMQYRDPLTLSFIIFSQTTEWLQSLTDAILNDLFFSIDFDSLHMKKKLHGSVLTPFLTNILFTQY